MRSLSHPLFRFVMALLAVVLVGCLYTWEQLAACRLLLRLESLEVARETAHEELMVELGLLREIDSRAAVEEAARVLALHPVSPERLVVLTNAADN